MSTKIMAAPGLAVSACNAAVGSSLHSLGACLMVDPLPVMDWQEAL
jgi:hypothetical protein